MVLFAGNTPLRTVGDILEAAWVLGHEAWNGVVCSSIDCMATIGDSSLSRDVLDLFCLLRDRGVRYVLVGGVALLKYVDGRNTQDIDFLFSPHAMAEVPELVVSQREHDFARTQFRSIRVDVLLTSDPVFKLVHDRHATTHAFQEVGVTCATVEGLLLLKLYALPSLYRQGDTQRIALYETDILMLLDRHRPDITAVLQILEPFVEEGAMVELRNIVEDIQQRIARMRRDSGST